MVLRITTAVLTAMMAAAASAASAQAPEVAAAHSLPAPTFIAADFVAPVLAEGPSFKLVPLGPELVNLDFAAYMSSIEHLQRTFTRSTGWPHAEITAQEAMTDMLTEQTRFETRTSFAYGVLTPDGSRERGCVYVYPSTVPGFDAVIRLWVTKAEFDAGFDAELYEWTKAWIASDWEFGKVAYPGRSIAWETWDELVKTHSAS